ncbi:uncharacterized protein V6R79_010620 [Siganus canaliculatus]
MLTVLIRLRSRRNVYNSCECFRSVISHPHIRPPSATGNSVNADKYATVDAVEEKNKWRRMIDKNIIYAVQSTEKGGRVKAVQVKHLHDM